MNSEELRQRTKQFALLIIKIATKLLKTSIGRTISYQLVKAGTSVGANYRAVCRGRSKAEFNSKLHIVLEEADETVFWLELILESSLLPIAEVNPLLKEANELTAFFSRSYYTARRSE